MCTKEKKVLLWSNYLNSQLSILWENAKICGNTGSPECNYYRALAEFEYRRDTEAEDGPKDLIKFSKPQLLFLCNHSAILYLTVEEGLLTGVSSGDGSAASITLPDTPAAFRVSFTRTHVVGRDSKIDDQAANHEVRMVVFDFEKATLVSEHEDKSVKDFFIAYLRFLRMAGHHVLFGLPDFTDTKRSTALSLDYVFLEKKMTYASAETLVTLVEIGKYCEGLTYSGITSEQINKYVAEVQYGRADLRAQEKRDIEASSISRVRWKSSEGIEYDINFDTPDIIPFCQRELLFILKLRDVKQRDGTEVILQQRDVVFVVNVVEFDGKHLKIDFRTARFMSFFSSSFEAGTTSSTSVESLILKYLEVEYLNILTKHGYNVIYGPAGELSHALFKDGGFWKRVHNVVDFLAIRRHSESEIWAARTYHASLDVVSQTFALSERSIERLLRTKWTEHQWTEENFTAKFGPLRIRLLSSNKIIVVVYLEEVQLKPKSQVASSSSSIRQPPTEIFLDDGDQVETVEDKQTVEEPSRWFKGFVTFEADLDIVVADVTEDARMKSHTFILNMKTALLEESLTDLYDTVAKQQADEATSKAICGFTHSYLRRLEDEKISLGVMIRERLTVFSHTILTERELNLENLQTTHFDASESDSSLLVVYGATKASEESDELPKFTFNWSPGWLPSATVNGIGTVWISGRNFIDHILEIFEEFNSETTLVREESTDRFITLKTREAVKKRRWLPDLELADPRCLVYSWYYHYDATRREEGTYVKHHWDSLILKTQNHVWIPTRSVAKGNQIKMALTGEHEIQASRKGSTSKITRVEWRLMINITYASSGLSVTVKPDSKVTDRGQDTAGITIDDPYDVDERFSARMEDLASQAETRMTKLFTESSLYKWFSDWKAEHYDFANPIFTRAGDLVFEVYETSQGSQTDAQLHGQPTGSGGPQPPPAPGPPGPTNRTVQQPNTPPRPATPQTGPQRGGPPAPAAQRGGATRS